MIALSPARKYASARYVLVGELSENASWVQTLELPADGNAVSISGQIVYITFREFETDTAADLTISTTNSQISITDADTLSISVTDEVMSALDEERYVVDLYSDSSGTITHWAHGTIKVNTSP